MLQSPTSFYNFILDSMSEGFAIQDHTGKIIRFNKSALDIFGLTTEEYLGKTSDDPSWVCIHEDGSVMKVEDFPVTKVLRTGIPQKNVIMGIKHKLGSTVWIQANSIPFNNQIQDSPVAVLSTFSDVSILINNKIDLVKREKQLLETQAVALIGCWTYNVSCNAISWTPEMYKIFGIDPDGIEASVDEISKRIHPDDLEMWQASLQRSHNGESHYKCRYRVVHPDRIIWVDSHGKCFYDENGNPTEMHGTCQDITDITQLEMQNGFIISALNIGVWKWDIKSSTIEWDHNMFAIFGADPSLFSGSYESWSSCLHPEDREKAMQDCQKVLSGSKSFDSMFRVITSTGEIRHVGSKGVVSRDEKSEVKYIYGLCWDRTNDVLLEKQVESERLKAIQVSKLSALGEMAGGVAHEINNPLAIIHGCVTVLKKHKAANRLTDETLMDSLQDIETTVKRISNIVVGLRNLSRDSSLEQTTKFYLRDVFNDVLSICNEKFKLHDVELLVDDPDKLYDSVIDSRQVQLAQVVLNLFTNAYDAVSTLPKRWVHLKLRKCDTHVQIRVEDSGMGIPKNVAEKIFNPFFTTKEIGKGTGLGLSLSRTLVENNHGQLYIDENCPHTCFVIDLPITNKAA